jgi:hypothetical protein
MHASRVRVLVLQDQHRETCEKARWREGWGGEGEGEGGGGVGAVAGVVDMNAVIAVRFRHQILS